jgi:cytochrome b
VSDSTITRRVWDLPVRFTHWALVLAFVGAWVSHEAGVQYFTLHRWFGYAVLVLVGFRLTWGFVGTRHARFAGFLRGPRATWHYLRALLRGAPASTPGHNPLGALMAVALLAGLAVQALTGLFANDEIFNVGPLYGYVSDARSLALTSLHRQLFYWIAGFVLVHVLAVAAHLVFKKDNLVKPMFTGRKPATRVAQAQEIGASRLWLALLLATAIAGLLGWVLDHAPIVAASFE